MLVYMFVTCLFLIRPCTHTSFAVQAVRKSSKVFLEAYTSELSVGAERLVSFVVELEGTSCMFATFGVFFLRWLPFFLQSAFYENEVVVADRDCVEVRETPATPNFDGSTDDLYSLSSNRVPQILSTSLR